MEPSGGGGIVMRIHRVRAEIVVAACDEELLGQDLPVGTQGRTVRVSPQFYGERRVGREELLWALARATTANLLGARTIALAQEGGILDGGATGSLGGVPHAEIFTMPS
ncbi:MAG: DUF424 family protein [Thermoplasmata archaeon]